MILDRGRLSRPQNLEWQRIPGQHDLLPSGLAFDEFIVEPAVGAAPPDLDRRSAPRIDRRRRFLRRLYP
ncbi:MAG: hypothetical protein WBD71_14240, partial [Xanthobacteraceae bacterium]